MNTSELRKIWQNEENIAHIVGWDFSHINGRYEEDTSFPWNYRDLISQYLTAESSLLDYDTGGGEFLLSLGHPHAKTAATEGYPPNVQLCKERLLPLGIDFRECADASSVPFQDESFDIIINRHGDFNSKELFRLLKKGGIFITQQVGEGNDRDLVKAVLPDIPKPFPNMNLSAQSRIFEETGFEIIKSDEAFRKLKFYDIGAFVWFARIIEWEFSGFSVEKCFDNLLKLQKTIDENGFICGTTHRYMIVAKKT